MVNWMGSPTNWLLLGACSHATGDAVEAPRRLVRRCASLASRGLFLGCLGSTEVEELCQIQMYALGSSADVSQAKFAATFSAPQRLGC